MQLCRKTRLPKLKESSSKTGSGLLIYAIGNKLALQVEVQDSNSIEEEGAREENEIKAVRRTSQQQHQTAWRILQTINPPNVKSAASGQELFNNYSYYFVYKIHEWANINTRTTFVN